MAGPSPSSSNLSQHIDHSPPESTQSHTSQSQSGQTSIPSSSADTTSVVTSAPDLDKGLPLYVCGHCGRRYSRPEHLQRHVQTHTLGRRFACGICGKTFARADLKKRHETNHENDDSKKRRRTTTSLNSGRVTRACKPCAAARVKCQEEKPCQRCVRRGLTCISAEAGSAAAMNLVHLSASARSQNAGDEKHDSSNASSEHVPTNVPNLTSYPADQASMYGQSSQSQSQSRSVTPNLGDLPANSEAGSSSHTVADQLPFCDFLQNVLYEQQYEHPAKMPENQGLAVLDFCNDTNMELSDMDFGLLDHWNADGMVNTIPPQQEPPKVDNSTDIAAMQQNLVTAWDVSPWRWDPVAEDNAFGEQGNLPVSQRDAASIQAQASKGGLRRAVDQKLDFTARDGVLALVLSTYQPDTMPSRISGSFPSADLLDTMVHIFLNSFSNQVSNFIHFPTFKLNKQEPEFIANTAAAGAVLTPIPTLRKFGYALQEAIRIVIPRRFEENNESILNLGMIQAIVIGQDIGLWSGNRRKMEIAECHVNIPTTMMRYRGKFQRSSYSMISVTPSDEGTSLEQKWRTWVDMEKWKRFVFHLFLRDSQQSMTTLTNPVMSYAELTLPLPASKELWYAKTANDWKHAYLRREAGEVKRAPSVCDLFRDLNLLAESRHRIDTQFSAAIYLQAFWQLILEYRNLCSSFRTRSYSQDGYGNSDSLLNARRHQLLQDLQAFKTTTMNWPEVTAQERLLLNQLMMGLHISLDDLQLFAGKEGDEQAHRAFPVLQQWVESVDSRAAIWHAGQILRFAKLFPPAQLKNFYAVGVHHAALTLWTYGVITRAGKREDVSTQHEKIYIDGPESLCVQGYINLGRGVPAVRGPSSRNGASEALIENPKGSMEAAHEVLQANFSGGNIMAPSIVENLQHEERLAALSIDDKVPEEQKPSDSRLRGELERFRQLKDNFLSSAADSSTAPNGQSAEAISDEVVEPEPEPEPDVEKPKEQATSYKDKVGTLGERRKFRRVCKAFRDHGHCRKGYRCRYFHFSPPSVPSTPFTNNPMDLYFAGYHTFDHQRNQPFFEEFDRMRDHFGWTDHEATEPWCLFRIALVQEFNYIYGEDENDLANWQKMFKIIGLPSPATLEEAQRIMRVTRVNLVDMAETERTFVPVKLFDSLEDLADYCHSSGKIFPKELAYAGGLLRMLLREIDNKYHGTRLGGTELV
ncbi:putative transcription factor Pig1p [Fusarium heterosporum]|uniref:Putative transcription factor Pig1p n=1 Tax=Fusarium heterosporum TaxID=42747 RepID=A0A8H5T275_FUSHE|nr:putative transcription factor Pig1p [Fusarium heterosporum]